MLDIIIFHDRRMHLFPHKNRIFGGKLLHKTADKEQPVFPIGQCQTSKLGVASMMAGNKYSRIFLNYYKIGVVPL